MALLASRHVRAFNAGVLSLMSSTSSNSKSLVEQEAWRRHQEKPNFIIMHNYASLWQNVAECCIIFRILHNLAQSAQLATFNVWGNALKNYAKLCNIMHFMATFCTMVFLIF